MRETHQLSPTTIEVPEKSHVKHHIVRPRGLLRQAWEDVSYDLAPQAADN